MALDDFSMQNLLAGSQNKRPGAKWSINREKKPWTNWK